jgi:hypothetical protein
LQPLERIADERAGRLAGLGAEERAQKGGDHALLVLAHVPERLAQEVDGASLPGTPEHLADRLLEAGVRVGDDQLHAAQAALNERAQEGAPEGLRLGLADVEGDHLPIAGLVHAVGEHERLAHDAA